MIVTNFDNELRPERLPFARALGRPAARAARRLAGETGRLDQALEFLGQRPSIVRLDVRREADVIEQALVVVKAEQERADHVHAFAVPEPTDHAIGAAEVLDLL